VAEAAGSAFVDSSPSSSTPLRVPTGAKIYGNTMKEPQAMSRSFSLLAASAAATLALPLSAAGARRSHTPRDYRPECESLYQAANPVLDHEYQSDRQGIYRPIEVGVCGERRHVP
jgi:hypothetical protein